MGEGDRGRETGRGCTREPVREMDANNGSKTTKKKEEERGGKKRREGK